MTASTATFVKCAIFCFSSRELSRQGKKLLREEVYRAWYFDLHAQVRLVPLGAFGRCLQFQLGAVSEGVVVSVYLDDYTVLSLGHYTFIARGVCFVDAQAVRLFFRVVSGIWATTVEDARPHVDRYGLGRISRGTALPLHHYVGAPGLQR